MALNTFAVHALIEDGSLALLFLHEPKRTGSYLSYSEALFLLVFSIRLSKAWLNPLFDG